MKILKFVKALNPVFERKEVMAVLNELSTELKEHTLPIAHDVQEAFSGKSLKSKYAQNTTNALRRHARFQGSGLELVVSSLETLEGNVSVLEKEVKRLFSFQFSTENITYDRANILRYIETASFYVRYTRKFMLRLVAEEALAIGNATKMDWSKAERAWIDNGLKDWAAILPVVALNEQQLKQRLSQASNALIDATTHDTAMSTLGRTKIDPMHLEGFSPMSNPIFSLGKAVVEYKVKRFQAAKEEHQALQLRLQELRELQDEGKASPKLQKLIQHTEGRVEELDYRLTKQQEESRLEDD